MFLTIDNSNALADHLLVGGIVTAAGAIAASGTAVTALGGAAFGASNYVLEVGFGHVANDLFNVDSPNASQTAKTVAALASRILAIVATTTLLSLAGVPITLGMGFLLAVTSIFTAIIPACAVGCCCPSEADRLHNRV